MAEADSPTPSKLLPDKIHRAVRPGMPCSGCRRRTPAKAFSRRVVARLPGRRDRAARPHPSAHRTPRTHHARRPGRRRLGGGPDPPARLDDWIVHLDSFPVGDDTVLIACGENDHFALLVVPPHTTADAARVAMARAVDADNITSTAPHRPCSRHRLLRVDSVNPPQRPFARERWARRPPREKAEEEGPDASGGSCAPVEVRARLPGLMP